MRVYKKEWENGGTTYSTQCYNKDLQGVEHKCYMQVRFKKGLEPNMNDYINLDVQEFFMSCDNKNQPVMIITKWYQTQPKESNYITADDIKKDEIDLMSADLPF